MLVLTHSQTAFFFNPYLRDELSPFMELPYLMEKDSKVPYYSQLSYSYYNADMANKYPTMIPVHPLCLALQEDEYFDCF